MTTTIELFQIYVASLDVATSLDGSELLALVKGGLSVQTTVEDVTGFVWTAPDITGAVTIDATGTRTINSGSTPFDFWSLNINGYPTSGTLPVATMEGIAVKLVIPSSFNTSSTYPATAASFYALGNSSLTSTVPLFTFGGQQSPNARPYGANFLVSNSPTVADLVNTGLDFGAAFGLEINANIMKKVGAITPVGQLIGLSLKGSSEVVPSLGAIAVEVDLLGGGLAWSTAFETTDGAATNGMSLGTISTGNDVNSQSIGLRSRTAGGLSQTTAMLTDPDGNLLIGLPALGPRARLQHASVPILQFNVTGAGANLKHWDIVASVSSLIIQAGNDADSTATPAITINRGSTFNITSIVLSTSSVAGTPIAGFSVLGPSGAGGDFVTVQASTTAGLINTNAGGLTIGSASGVTTMADPSIALGTTSIVSLGAASLAANDAVATSLTGVGPVGSHTTVQEWMVVKGSTGATRWIPMF